MRTIVLDCGLTEVLKWGVPCYTHKKANVALLHTFKEYCAILFVKGALLNDADDILIQQTENTQAARQIRFTSVQEIDEMIDELKAYIFEAIEVEKAGLKVDFKQNIELVFCDEFQDKLAENPELKNAFDELTPGRQRGYNVFFSAAKQAKTRDSRIEKSIPQILNGKGLNED